MTYPTFKTLWVCTIAFLFGSSALAQSPVGVETVTATFGPIGEVSMEWNNEYYGWFWEGTGPGNSGASAFLDGGTDVLPYVSSGEYSDSLGTATFTGTIVDPGLFTAPHFVSGTGAYASNFSFVPEPGGGAIAIPFLVLMLGMRRWRRPGACAWLLSAYVQ